MGERRGSWTESFGTQRPEAMQSFTNPAYELPQRAEASAAEIAIASSQLEADVMMLSSGVRAYRRGSLNSRRNSLEAGSREVKTGSKKSNASAVLGALSSVNPRNVELANPVGCKPYLDSPEQ